MVNQSPDGGVAKGAPQDMTQQPDQLAALDIIRRGARVIAISVGTALIAALLWLALATPKFTATALIQIDMAPGASLGESALATNAAVETARIETEVELLRSDAVAVQTAQSLGLADLPEFAPKPGLRGLLRTYLGGGTEANSQTGAHLIARLKSALKIRRQGITYVVSVSAQAADAQLAARIANTHAQTYIQGRIIAEQQDLQAARQRLAAQAEAQKDMLGQLDADARTAASETLSRLLAESDLPGHKSLADQLRVGDAELHQLAEQLDRLGAEPDWQAITDALGAEAHAQADHAEPDGAARLIADLAQEAQDRAAEQSALLATAGQEVQDLAVPAGDLTALYAMRQEADIARSILDQTLARMHALDQQAALLPAPGRIVSPALIPAQPSFPRSGWVLAAALFAGLGIGVIAALLQEFFFGTVSSAQHLAQLLGAPVGAAIPKTAPMPQAHCLTDRIPRDPLSPYAEEFRKLRASIDQCATPIRRAGARVILCCSAQPEEGKSSLALGLARTYALAGKTTLLIDADLRNPSMHRRIDVCPNFGLRDHLITQLGANAEARANGAPRDFYVPDPQSPLGVVLGSELPFSHPTDALLQSESFTDLIANARERFDIVILDSAPLLPVADTRYVAPLVDVALLSARFETTRHPDIRAAHSVLQSAMQKGSLVMGVLSHYPGGRQAKQSRSYMAGEG